MVKYKICHLDLQLNEEVALKKYCITCYPGVSAPILLGVGMLFYEFLYFSFEKFIPSFDFLWLLPVVVVLVVMIILTLKSNGIARIRFHTILVLYCLGLAAFDWILAFIIGSRLSYSGDWFFFVIFLGIPIFASLGEFWILKKYIVYRINGGALW